MLRGRQFTELPAPPAVVPPTPKQHKDINQQTKLPLTITGRKILTSQILQVDVVAQVVTADGTKNRLVHRQGHRIQEGGHRHHRSRSCVCTDIRVSGPSLAIAVSYGAGQLNPGHLAVAQHGHQQHLAAKENKKVFNKYTSFHAMQRLVQMKILPVL